MEDKKEESLLQETPITGDIKDELEKRKEKIISFLKKKIDWIYYVILSLIIFVSLYIRTRNISKLKDITTGTWTLGPDLDPFLFLRWAKYIAEHGKLFLLDTMRYVPLAEICQGSQCSPVNTTAEMNLLSYMIVGVYKFLSFFYKEVSVTYSAILFPVIMFGLTLIAFFLFARKIFYKEDKTTRNIIALISTAFFALIPSLLPRTIAGIPEKESVGFLFIFLSFYFFLEAFSSEKLKKSLIFGILAGIMTGLLALVWGGIVYVFMTIAGAVLFFFLLGRIDEKKFYVFSLWIVSFMIIILSFSTRYPLQSLITSSSSTLVFMTFFVLLTDFVLFKKKIFGIERKIKIKLPKEIISLIIAVTFLVILASLTFGISFVPDTLKDIISHTVNPLTQGRFSVTVAENKQPYFINDWKNDFGPVWLNIPLYFWLFFIGSVILFSQLIKALGKRERVILVFSYFIFLISLIFSKYSSSGILNGESNLSLMVYFGGVLFFLGSFAYFYFKRYKEEKLSIFKEFDFSYILYFVILTMTIIAARGAVRLIMVLGAVSPIAIGFLIVKPFQRYFKEKEETIKFFLGILILIILVASIFTLWTYYKQDKAMAENFAPGTYQWQWQKAMAWVRENTQKNAVFAHWWDYGYWLQSIGERATILDGGNAIGYWNYFMGRYVLTGTDEQKALEFLYAHNGTHLLIDSTEIGKYAAFSSIGSDENYDRFSWITTFLLDEKQTRETNNGTIYIYGGGSGLDEDIIWKENEEEILLPKRKATIGAIILRKTSDGEILQPEGIFIYNGNQYKIPLRFMYLGGRLYNFNSGLEAGVFLLPRLEPSPDGRANINEIGAMLYLSKRIINSQLAKLYLFNQKSDYFKLVHVEDSLINEDLKRQGIDIGEFVYYQGIQGPIKIWEIKYPSNIKLDTNYLDTDYPLELATVKPGEY